MSGVLLLILRILLALILYSFLGFAMYTLWKDLRRQSDLLLARQPIPITLSTNVDGPPLTRHFTCAEVVLGREATCDFPINDQTVSSRHARLSYHQTQWWVEDLASTNGTFLNGEMVAAQVVITHGDELYLGQVGVKIAIGQKEQQSPVSGQ